MRVLSTGEIYVESRQRPFMITVISDGAIVKQTEMMGWGNIQFQVLPVGIYDVRLEGDGVETIVRRGIHVTAGDKTDVIVGPMRAGKGVKIIEYATDGLSSEEIAARLEKLETAVAEIQKRRQGR